MKAEARLYVKGPDGNPVGPFRWTAVREWVAIGYFTPADEVRGEDETEWISIRRRGELLSVPPTDDINDVLTVKRARARERKPVGPRAAAYLARLGCPVRLERLNPHTALAWVQILEELRRDQADATERWAAAEEAQGRTPAATADDATAEQIALLRARGLSIKIGLTRLEARRLIAGPPTEEQLDRLKFYGIALPEGAGKDEAAEIISRQMRDNWSSEEAYQAYRQGNPDTPGTTPRSGLKLREPVEPPPAEPSRFEPAQPIAAPRRRRTGPVLFVVALLAGFGVVATVWMTRNRPSKPEPATVAGLSPEARLARAVTILEAPNAALGEKLRDYVMTLELTGLVAGAEPRALIGGQLRKVGDVLDRARGVVVVQIEPARKAVVFSDAAGNIVQRTVD